jgi:hypothetical protein
MMIDIMQAREGGTLVRGAHESGDAKIGRGIHVGVHGEEQLNH